ncbi:hypothetical protein [Gilliamella apicola]|uniref:hypothetical protein n=1 Tax=Gilliamella apicola TaxID=1196095 RepID=UPI002FEDE81E
MLNNTSSSKPTPTYSGFTITSTGVGGSLLGLAELLPDEWQIRALIFIPLISPTFSYLLMHLRCKFTEPLEITSMRSALKRDLKQLKKILKDECASKQVKQKAQKEYDDTLLKIANINKNFANSTKEINMHFGEKEDS